MLEEKLEVRQLKRKIRFYIGLIQMHKSVKELKEMYQRKKDAFFLAMKTYFRAFKLQKKYQRLRLRNGPDIEARALRISRNCINFVTFNMHGLMQAQAAPKIADFLKDRFAKE
jgi:hypothetical protein